jgi:hypothetical protein
MKKHGIIFMRICLVVLFFLVFFYNDSLLRQRENQCRVLALSVNQSIDNLMLRIKAWEDVTPIRQLGDQIKKLRDENDTLKEQFFSTKLILKRVTKENEYLQEKLKQGGTAASRAEKLSLPADVPEKRERRVEVVPSAASGASSLSVSEVAREPAQPECAANKKNKGYLFRQGESTY